MEKLKFIKIEATGNDFILFDNRDGFLQEDKGVLFRRICERRRGVGADGVILVEDHPAANFSLKFFNPDGNRTSMCGNGSRCAAYFAKMLGIFGGGGIFSADDGDHYAQVIDDLVKISLNVLPEIEEIRVGDEICWRVHTGVPHLIVLVDSADSTDVARQGRYLRFNPLFKPEGVNVNFVEILSENLVKLRTYERGVEAETLSCGTGSTAAAFFGREIKSMGNPITVRTRGGDLKISWNREGKIFLSGPVRVVYEGVIFVKNFL
ncbi:MAG: diaminopimelate epimerase [Fidelibacterota bacterium]